MLERILPRVVDNDYRGHGAGLWLLVPVLVAKIGIALGTIFNGRQATQSADGIPLDTSGLLPRRPPCRSSRSGGSPSFSSARWESWHWSATGP